MAFCAACGGQMADGATVCGACGKSGAQSAGGGAAAAPATAGGGLADNVAGALAYVTIIPAIIFLVMAPYNQNKFVKFHAIQCLGLAVVGVALTVFNVIPILGQIVFIFGHLALFVLWIVCVVKAYGGNKFKVPVIGDFAEKTANG